MTEEIDYEEIGAAACFDEFDEMEIEVIAAEQQADCHDHSGCAGCLLLPILILTLAVFGSLLFLF